VLYLGFEVRVELALRDGQELWAQVSRNDIEGLKLAPGQAIYITPTREKVFA
jgi:ABC-type molybdate transport system ATPase subunit